MNLGWEVRGVKPFKYIVISVWSCCHVALRVELCRKPNSESQPGQVCKPASRPKSEVSRNGTKEAILAP